MIFTDKPQISIESLLYKLDSWHILHDAYYSGESHQNLILEKHINEDTYRITVFGNGWKNQLYFGSDLTEVVRIWNNYKPKEEN